MSTDISRRTVAVVASGALVLAVAAVAVGAGSVGSNPAPSPSPSTPVASPSPQPVVTPGPVATPEPVNGPASPALPMPVRVPLDIVDDHDVVAVIDDRTGWITSARSGKARDGMSVRWFDIAVRNLDETTIEVTWVGLPLDDEVGVFLGGESDGVTLHFTQKAPPVDSDAIGFDRVLVLSFDHPVDAATVQATFTASAS
jgi:hypothetical protein